MSVKVEKLEKGKAKFTIEVNTDTITKVEDTVFNKQKGKLSIPGFRKGKVTKEMAYKVYGKGVFLEDTINECINETYYDAVKETGEKVLSRPEIKVVSADIDKPLIYEAIVAIMPEAKLPKYKGISLTKTKPEVKDEDIERRLKDEQEKNARIVSVERESKKDDIVDINFEGFVDNVAFKGGKAEKYQLTLGSKSFIDTFEDQLIGKKAGDDVDVNVTFPKEYGEKSLAGKPALFKVHINEVKEKQLPEINDEFVSEISEFENLKDYKEDIKKHLLEIREKQTIEFDKGRILEEIAKDTTLELAPEAIDSQLDEMIYNLDNRMRYQGMTFDKYLEMMGKSMEDYRKEQRPQAESNLKKSVILEQIAKDEKIEASDAMIDAEIEKMAKTYGMEVEQFKKAYAADGDRQRIKDDLLYPAVLDFLYTNANLK